MQRIDRLESLVLSTQSMIRAWKSYFYKALEPEDISPMQMGVLFHLGSNPGATGRSISSALHVSPSALAQLIDGLEELGCITRQQDAADKRIIHFDLSAAGLEKWRSLEAKRRESFERVTATLTDEEIEVLMSLQNKITDQTSQLSNKGDRCS